MNFLQSIFPHKGTFKLAFVGMACLLFFIPLVKAEEQVKRETASVNKLSNNLVQLSQQKVCPSVELLPTRSFETDKYYVFICRGNQKSPLGYYVRFTKNGGTKITIPVSSKIGETYLATKGEATYVVTPYELVVTKVNRRDRVIFREKVNNAIAADGQPLARACPDGNTTFVEAETKNFIVYICGREVPDSYVAVARNGNNRIALPLQKYNSSGNMEDSQYVAVNGDIRYILTRKLLKVSRDGRNIVKEKVLHWN
ncbi:MAG: hypothetical protein HXY43_08875 [Fischerella sp.]|jgi:hypothetical protein|uniref:hypothetical protein n=1 Tax=Fischerella sp. TaxID=1191 RepID=UPI0017954AF0|nr:hypothetical protein [Fischerella sp.]NWF59402.1 hypothetical protein [Fischerella sp.]